MKLNAKKFGKSSAKFLPNRTEPAKTSRTPNRNFGRFLTVTLTTTIIYALTYTVAYTLVYTLTYILTWTLTNMLNYTVYPNL